jgi:hypothetical protein
MECDTLLLSVGLIPENELSKAAGVELDPVTGGAVVDGNLQTSVEGIFSCGNVLHVHDVVDWVSLEAEKAGRSAALFLKGEPGEKDAAAATAAATVIEVTEVKAGEGIRYVVPQNVDMTKAAAGGGLQLSFRVKEPGRDTGVEVLALSGDGSTETVVRKNYKRTFPAEMIRIELTEEQLQAARGAAALEVRLAESGSAEQGEQGGSASGDAGGDLND